NDTLAGDGTRRPDGFVAIFDRPVDPNTFSIADVTVIFRNPNTPGTDPGVSLGVLSVTPLNLGTFGPAQALGATQFFVKFDPSKALQLGGSYTGTYSYTVGPLISDRIRAPILTVIPGPTNTYAPPPNQQNLPIPAGAPAQTTGPTTPTHQVRGFA